MIAGSQHLALVQCVNERERALHNTGNDFEWIINISAFVITLCACPFFHQHQRRPTKEQPAMRACDSKTKERGAQCLLKNACASCKLYTFCANTRSAARPKAKAVSCEALGVSSNDTKPKLLSSRRRSVSVRWCDFPIWPTRAPP